VAGHITVEFELALTRKRPDQDPGLTGRNEHRMGITMNAVGCRNIGHCRHLPAV